MADSVKNTLLQMEHDLSQKVSVLRRQLAPLEKDLGDVRKALAAITPHEIGLRRAVQYAGGGAMPSVLGRAAESPYRKLTMKQLILKALEEHFENGATAAELIAFFKNAWDRDDIIRASLSPQLSRLKTDEKIKLDGRVWSLVANDGQKDEAPPNGSGSAPKVTGEAETSPFDSQ